MIWMTYRYRPERKADRAEHIAWCQGIEGGQLRLPQETLRDWEPITEGVIPDKDLHTWPHRLQINDVKQLIAEQKPNAVRPGDAVILQSERTYTADLTGTWLFLWCGDLHLDSRDLFEVAMEGRT